MSWRYPSTPLAVTLQAPCALFVQSVGLPLLSVQCHPSMWYYPLTTERRTPPDRSHPSLATVASVGFKGITETGVS